jgi:glucose/arabinose dehydrogenase
VRRLLLTIGIVAALGVVASACQAPTRLEVDAVVPGLDRPWDVAFVPNGPMMVTERSGPVNVVRFDGSHYEVARPADVVAQSEGGMMGLAVDPAFATNRRVYTCFMSNAGGALDVRVVRWRLNEALTALTSRADIVTGIPVNTSGQAGRHSGCRTRFGPDGFLWVTTGDAAMATVPQDRTSLGGKVLRVDTNGNGAPGNPGGTLDPRIYSFGHRNPQGISFRPSDRLPVVVEHGTGCDDEVNGLRAGGNYGWDPRRLDGGPGYDESRPMTDTVRHPGAIPALWRSGCPTIAPSGATFLDGPQWQLWGNGLAMAVLKGQQLRVMKLDNPDASASQEWTRLTDQGRLRVAVQGPDGNLYVATDASPGRILRVVPRYD